jgi:hypothetical protein
MERAPDTVPGARSPSVDEVLTGQLRRAPISVAVAVPSRTSTARVDVVSVRRAGIRLASILAACMPPMIAAKAETMVVPKTR